MAAPLAVSKNVPPVAKRIDNYAQLLPPLDYSFHNAQTLEGKIARSFAFFPSRTPA